MTELFGPSSYVLNIFLSGTLGNLIRRIDYLRAKGKYEYKNGGDNPYELLEKFEKQGDTLNFNDLQVFISYLEPEPVK